MLAKETLHGQSLVSSGPGKMVPEEPNALGVEKVSRKESNMAVAFQAFPKHLVSREGGQRNRDH